MNELSISLIAWTKPTLPPGTVLRFPASYPYEAWVDFMVVRLPTGEAALLVSTGYKAGLIPQVLPETAGPLGGGITTEWLIANWAEWVWPATPVADVRVLEGYSALGSSD